MEIKDYLHLYIGQKLQRGGTVTHALLDACEKSAFDAYADIKPILRKLSDMTEEECDKYGIAYLNGEYTKDCFEADATYGTTFKVYGIKSLSERVIQMCKDGWDVFGLIPAGLAIDKTSLI